MYRSHWRALLVPLVLLIACNFAAADLLNDFFGVTLTLEERTDYCDVLGDDYTRHVFSNDWAPSQSTTEWAVNDYTAYWSQTDLTVCDNTQIAGGEPYDVEAIYFDDDFENLYLAFVTSFPGPDPDGGYIEPRIDDILVHSGDLALDFGINGASSGTDPFNYDYGVNINNEVRQASGDAEANANPALGGDVYQTANSDWYLGNQANAADTPREEQANFDPEFGSFSGSYAGAATVDFYQYDFGGLQENFADTYVLEAIIPFTVLPPLAPGDRVSAQWVMGCRNDGGSANNVLRVDGEINPEPGTMALVGLGLGALVGWRRRKQ